jgi:hypothetical protein
MTEDTRRAYALALVERLVHLGLLDLDALRANPKFVPPWHNAAFRRFAITIAQNVERDREATDTAIRRRFERNGRQQSCEPVTT